MSTLNIRLVGAETYSFRKKKYVKGQLYKVSEELADELLAKRDSMDREYFRLPHDRDTEGEEAVEAGSTSGDKPKKRATKKAAKKTLKVSGGKVSQTAAEGEGEGEVAAEGEGEGEEGVEV